MKNYNITIASMCMSTMILYIATNNNEDDHKVILYIQPIKTITFDGIIHISTYAYRVSVVKSGATVSEYFEMIITDWFKVHHSKIVCP